MTGKVRAADAGCSSRRAHGGVRMIRARRSLAPPAPGLEANWETGRLWWLWTYGLAPGMEARANLDAMSNVLARFKVLCFVAALILWCPNSGWAQAGVAPSKKTV